MWNYGEKKIKKNIGILLSLVECFEEQNKFLVSWNNFDSEFEDISCGSLNIFNSCNWMKEMFKR